MSLIKRTRGATLLAGLALIAALAGTALAGSGPEVTSSASAKKTAKKALKLAKKANEKAKRAQGAADSAGSAASSNQAAIAALPRTSWAKVDTNSAAVPPVVLGGRNVTGVSRAAVGEYTVKFNHPILPEACSWTATLNDNDSLPAEPGEIAVGRNTSSDPNTLKVYTYASNGNPSDPSFNGADGFSINVLCNT